MKKDEIFFSVSGLTSTSANHVANLAKEFIASIEEELSLTRFFSSRVTVIGSNTDNYITLGRDKEFLESIEEKLTSIVEAKSLIAWLREAIKAREVLFHEVQDLTVNDYCHLVGKEVPVMPKKEDPITEEEYLSTLSVKDRNLYYTLETKCAVYGKYIHPGGSFSEARKEYNNKKQNPTRVDGNGRDTLIYNYIPTVEPKDIEDTFFTLQNAHRETQAQLNGLKHNMEEAIRLDTASKNTKYSKELADYQNKVNTLNAEMQVYKDEKNKEISKLKIVIPNSLGLIYLKIQDLGKK